MKESPERCANTSALQAAFARSLDGEARFRDHPAFGNWYAAIAWNQRDFSREPACIVRAASERDVVRTIAFAKAHNQHISVRGTGHSYAGIFLKEHSILLDLSRLRDIEIDAPNSRAMVQPGVTSELLYNALAVHGLAFPTGHGGQVGLGGFLLGGGLGINCGQWGGMSVFNIEALDVVTADGQPLHVTATSHPDLFWAARGAGPALFFVVTRFYLKCWPMPGAILSSSYVGDIGKLDRLVAAIEQVHPATNLQVMIAITPQIGGDANTGDRTVLLSLLAFEETPALARQLRTSFLSRLESDLQTLEEDQPASFQSLYRQTEGMLICKRYRVDNILTDRAQEATQILKRHLRALPSPATAVLLVWRGQLVYPDAAFSAHGMFFMSTYAQWNDAKDDNANRHWLNGLYDELEPVSSGAYINEFDLEHRAAQVARCFSDENWQRLQKLRRYYDASRVFVSLDTSPVADEGQ
jgi:FAD/FMN-containing dehydrogenase